MNERDQLIAYLATLGALVIVFLAALAAAALGDMTSLEALGVGTVTGGLIGALRMPSQRQVQVDQPPNEPIPVKETKR